MVPRRHPQGRDTLAARATLALLVLIGAGCTEQLPLPGHVLSSGGRGARNGGERGEGGRGGQPGEPSGSGGRKVDAGPVEECVELGDVRQLVPQVVITLDRSTTMWKKYGTSTLTRLQTVQQAVRSLLKIYNDTIHFGYVEFPVATCQSATRCCASNIIPPNPQALSLIEKRWSCELLPPACGETAADSPVAPALRQSRWHFEDRVPRGSRHVLLMTDGEPSCAGNLDKNDCSLALDEVNTLLLGHRVSTRVFGLAEEVRGSACLDNLASLGHSQVSGQPPATHVVTLTPEQIYDELEKWFDALSEESCTFRLPGELTPPQRVIVRHNGTTVPHQADDGWQYDSANAPQRVILQGSWCDRIRTPPVGTVEFSVCEPAP